MVDSSGIEPDYPTLQAGAMTTLAHCPYFGTRHRIRTDNILDLNQTPLPIGLTGLLLSEPEGGREIGTGSGTRTRRLDILNIEGFPNFHHPGFLCRIV